MEWLLVIIIYINGGVSIEELRFAQRDECLEAEVYVSKTIANAETMCMLVERL